MIFANCHKKDLKFCWKGLLNIKVVFALAVRKWKEIVQKRKECRVRKSAEFVTQDADTIIRNRLICLPRHSGI